MKTLTCFVNEELLPNEIQNEAGTLTWMDFKADVDTGIAKRTHPVYLEVRRRRLGEGGGGGEEEGGGRGSDRDGGGLNVCVVQRGRVSAADSSLRPL
jgi:hypothetical protein